MKPTTTVASNDKPAYVPAHHRRGPVPPRRRVVKTKQFTCVVCAGPVTARPGFPGYDATPLLVRERRPGGTTFRSIGIYAHRSCVAPLVADGEEA